MDSAGSSWMFKHWETSRMGQSNHRIPKKLPPLSHIGFCSTSPRALHPAGPRAGLSALLPFGHGGKSRGAARRVPGQAVCFAYQEGEEKDKCSPGGSGSAGIRKSFHRAWWHWVIQLHPIHTSSGSPYPHPMDVGKPHQPGLKPIPGGCPSIC